jgi:glycogen operon protein
VKLLQPDWGPGSHSLALTFELEDAALHVHIILNAFWEPLEFELPLVNGGADPWRRWIDTSLDSPHDIVAWRSAQPLSGQTYRAGPRSVVVLGAGSGFND